MRNRPSSSRTSPHVLTPLRILTQIVTLQAAYYTLASALILFTALASGKPFSVDLVFSWQSLRGDTAVGWTLGLCWIVVAGMGSLLLLILISRSKLVPDFALTLHFLHLVATSLYSRSVPRNFLWWMLQAASASLMISLGIWSCRWRELKPINFGAAGAGEGKSEAAPTAGLLGEEGGRETGLGGEYEMVGINKGGGGS